MTSDSDTSRTGGQERGGRGMLLRRLLFMLPVLVFAVVAAYFLWGLQPGRNPREVPSGLVDKPVPQFSLPAIQGMDSGGLSTADLTGGDAPVLLNVFASWCVPCRVEHPILMRLAEQEGVGIYGINYKDAPADAKQWLANYGNPYTQIGALSEERADIGIELGIYGVPETYVIAPDGTIVYKHTGPIQPKSLNDKILPLLQDLRR